MRVISGIARVLHSVNSWSSGVSPVWCLSSPWDVLCASRSETRETRAAPSCIPRLREGSQATATHRNRGQLIVQDGKRN